MFRNKRIEQIEKDIKNIHYLLELNRIIAVRNSNLIEEILKEMGFNFEFIDSGVKARIIKKK